VWAVVLKLDVPADLVDLLIALHKVVDVHFEVDGVTHVLESIIGVKQGDILGPVLFNFIIWLRGEHDGVEASAGSGARRAGGVGLERRVTRCW
jgi:hypothetical protein